MENDGNLMVAEFLCLLNRCSSCEKDYGWKNCKSKNCIVARRMDKLLRNKDYGQVICLMGEIGEETTNEK